MTKPVPGIKIPYFIADQYPDVEGLRCVEILIPDDDAFMPLLGGLVKLAGRSFNYRGGAQEHRYRLAEMWRTAYDETDWEQCMNCEQLLECLQPLFDGLSAQITSLEAECTALQAAVEQVRETQEENGTKPPTGIENNVAGEICGGSAFVVGFMNTEIRRVYAEAEEGLLDNLLEAAVEVLRAIPVIETLPVDEMLNAVNLYFENQVADYIDDYDILYDDLIGSLACFVEANDNIFDYDVWGDWLVFVGEEYPSNRAAKLFAAFAPIRQSFASDILAGIFNRPTLKQWFDLIYLEYLAGTTVPIACPTYDCPEEWESFMDFAIEGYGWASEGTFDSGSGGTYGSGVWNSAFGVSSGNAYQMVQIGLAIDPSNITYMAFEYDVASIGTQATSDNYLSLATNVGSIAQSGTPTVVADDQTFSGSTDQDGVTILALRCQAGFQPGSVTDPGGSCAVKSVTVRGFGTKPSQLP